ncbi:hypothetical protein ABB37_01630 [Leptomonas pyrrhocoris]|uniref:SMP-LTD domain-containing protein n=1 Tax=Leptomonas pyrrhocoris TaxID=157538 RepID=A0A0M9G951_LEPPY|nr:hypothetical protein ABB37_01630 [Leptomonas pyrrhocoris]KPA85293.1 hypothetical protein ABB37_01630 [Leptomonas pyrrhocoris]|eukprot:XP_015663732.1 hypothetical protein ABB37_01630 [Leptomonas pyrrhocoris]
MSLHFNWSRLDETCAEALRQLINKRLAEVVEHINTKNAGGAEAARRSSLSAASHEFSTDANYGTGGRGGAAAGGKAAPPSLVSIGSSPGNNSNPTRNGPASNVSSHGSPCEGSNGLLGASDLISPSPFLSAMSPNGVQNSGSAAVGAVAAANAVNGCVAAPGESLPQSNHIRGAAPGLRADNSGGAFGGPTNDEGGTYAARSSAGHPSANNRGGNGATHATTSPSPTNASDAYNAGTGGPPRGAPLSGLKREKEGGASAADSRGVPPIVYLELGSVEWGTTPPFVEIVAFDNATDGPPGGSSRAPQRGFNAMNSTTTTAGSLQGEVRETSDALSHDISTDTAMALSTAFAGCFAASAPAGASAAGDAGVDSNSESSHDFTVSHPATGANTPHVVSGVGHQAGVASVTAGSPSCAAPQMQAPVSLSQFPCQPEATDSLASVLGCGGLYIRFHITYGGALHLSLNTAVQHELRLGAVALRVSLPMMFYLANLDLDCYLCLNVKHNVCQMWLEHGPLSSSVVNRLSIAATFGGANEVDEDGADYGASSADFYSHFGSSSISDDDNDEGGNGVYVNEHEVSHFVLHELRAILKETIVAPHCITIPISFDG